MEHTLPDEHVEHPHHRLVEEIAERVEQRLVAKFARWIAFNFLVIVGTVATVIGTYYALDTRITENQKIDELQDRLIMSHQSESAELRRELISEIRDLKRGQDEINRFLRDHNTMTMNGLNKK